MRLDHWSTLAIAVAALVALRLVVLATAGLELYADESQYWFWSTMPAFGYVSKPPLIAWLIGASTAVCGPSDVCVRLSAPLLQGATAILVALATAVAAGRLAGIVAGLIWITLPGVAVSSLIISTDVPILCAWAAALLVTLRLRRIGGSAGLYAWLGIAIGIGLLAKQAMIYFVLCLAIAAIVDRGTRRIVLDRRILLSLVLALLIIAPNLWWNQTHGWALVRHTAANASWGNARAFSLKEPLSFFGAQFGVFGPISFLLLLVTACRPRRLDGLDRMLLAFVLPVLLIVLVQAFLSRANDNWAAVAYVAASVLLARRFTDGTFDRLRQPTLVINLVLGLIVYVLAYVPLGPLDPFVQMRGWQAFGRQVGERVAAAGAPVLVPTERKLAAQLLRYAEPRPTIAVPPGMDGRAGNQFELSIPWQKRPGERALVMSYEPNPPALAGLDAKPVGELQAPYRTNRTRTVYLNLVDPPG